MFQVVKLTYLQATSFWNIISSVVDKESRPDYFSTTTNINTCIKETYLEHILQHPIRTILHKYRMLARVVGFYCSVGSAF